MRPKRWALLLAGALLLLAPAGMATARPSGRLAATVAVPGQITGSLVVSGLETTGPVCFYLSYNDPDFGDDHGAKRRMMFTDRSRPPFAHGSTVIDAVTPAAANPTPAGPGGILRLALPATWTSTDQLTVAFTSSVPRLPDSDTQEWFYEGFMPQLLATCPAPDVESVYWRSSLALDLTGVVTLPADWQYFGPGSVDPAGNVALALTSPTVAFALARGLTVDSFVVGDLPITVAYRSASFGALVPTIKNVLPLLTRMFGRLPFPTLTVVESSELQRHGLPGVIAINRPAQAVFNNVQRNWLNWQHWIVTSALARQWYGAAVLPQSPDDEWLFAGMNEFATLEALSLLPKRFNLFNADDGGGRFLSFDYLQSSELAAATLRQYAPFETLTDVALKTILPLRRQHPLMFVKHAFALRQLKHQLGEAPFFGLLRTLTASHLYSHLTPAQFKEAMATTPAIMTSQERGDVQSYLGRWWVNAGWPDFGLEDFTVRPKDDGGYDVRVTASQLGTIDFPPMVGVTDAAGQMHLQRATTGSSGLWEAQLTLATEPQQATIDPNHEAFDADRFDNASGTPGFQFFPGSADTLRDDGYTILWLPYALRRPGEPVSFGLQSAVFRYNQSILFLKAERAPSTGINAVEVRHRYQWPTTAMQADLLGEQDFDRDRLVEGTLTRAPVFAGNPRLALGLKLRHRERVREEQSRHATYAITANIKPLGSEKSCNYNLSLESERAPGTFADGFSYERNLGVALTTCDLTNTVSLALRAFAGKMSPFGPVPIAAAFKPTDLKEARIRLDERGLIGAKRLASFGMDLLLPFYLPLPKDSLIMTRQLRWRLFHDYARADDLQLDYQAAGVGFLLPFGGDVAGAGSLALTRLTVLAILYGRVGDDASDKRSIVFDLTGEL